MTNFLREKYEKRIFDPNDFYVLNRSNWIDVHAKLKELCGEPLAQQSNLDLVKYTYGIERNLQTSIFLNMDDSSEVGGYAVIFWEGIPLDVKEKIFNVAMKGLPKVYRKRNFLEFVLDLCIGKK